MRRSPRLEGTSAFEPALLSLALDNPNVLLGMLLGGMLPFLFSALTMNAVGRSANDMIEEVRRQFREISGLLEGEAEPDSARCVEISTRSAIREMVAPGLIAVLAPVLTGFVLGVSGLGGLLAGALVTGVLMALMMANAGGVWDNAKKYIEEGHHGGKGVGTAQGGGHRRHGRRPVQGHLGTESEHPHQADDHCCRHFRAARGPVDAVAKVDALFSGRLTCRTLRSAAGARRLAAPGLCRKCAGEGSLVRFCGFGV